MVKSLFDKIDDTFDTHSRTIFALLCGQFAGLAIGAVGILLFRWFLAQ